MKARALLSAILAIFGSTFASSSLAQGKAQPVLQLQLGHSDASNVAFSASPTGALVASVDQQGIIKVWETDGGRLVCTLDPGTPISGVGTGEVAKLAWSEDGTVLLSPDDQNGYFRWNLRKCGERERLDSAAQVTPEVVAPSTPTRKPMSTSLLALTTISGNRALAQTAQGMLELAPFGRPSLPLRSDGSSQSNAESNGSRVRASELPASILAISADGRIVLLGDYGGPKAALDRASGIQFAIPDFEGIDQPTSAGGARSTVPPGMRGYALSRSGRWLAIKSPSDSSLKLYEISQEAIKERVSIPIKVIGPPASASDPAAASQSMFANRADVAGLGFSTDERHVYVYRDGLSAFIQRSPDSSAPALEIRDIQTLQIERTISILEHRAVVMLGTRPILSLKPKDNADNLLLVNIGPTGPQTISAHIGQERTYVAVWPANVVGSVASVAMSSDSGFSQLFRLNSTAAAGNDLISSLRDSDAQRRLERRNRIAGTTVLQWNWEQSSSSSRCEVLTSSLIPELSTITSDGRFVIAPSRNIPVPPSSGTVNLVFCDNRSGQSLWTKSVEAPKAAAIDLKGTKVALWSGSRRLSLLDGATGELISALELDFKGRSISPRLLFSSDGDTLYFTDNLGTTGAVDVGTPNAPKLVWSRDSRRRYPLGFLPTSGRLLMPSVPQHVSEESTPYQQSLYGEWPKLLRLPLPEENGIAIANANESLVAVVQKARVIRLFDIQNDAAAPAGELTGFNSTLTAIAFSPNGRHLLAGDDQGGVWLFDVSQKRLLARMYSFDDGSWVVTDPQGRFDTNNIEALRRLHWVISDDPFHAYPLELFMRDFFEPQLLPRVMAGSALPPVPDITSINRALPQVTIARVQASATQSGRVDVTVRVRAERGADKRISGASDLHLLRAGQLVGIAKLDQPAQVAQLKSGQEVEITFREVRLPTQPTKIGFSAYAFNTDRVKSRTASTEYQSPALVGKSARRAFVVSVGVNKYDQPDWNLAYAANDARKTQEVLSSRLQKTGAYTDVIAIPLISDEGSSAAKKETLHTVLLALAGKPYKKELLADVPAAAKLDTATPDDLVIITFAGHGFNDEAEFYLVPQDVGTGKQIDAATRQHSISSNELADWLAEVDAGDISLVVDACHSAAAVESEGFKPGPMGAKGLGQLAYDKGMRVLAATQADDVALESGRLKQGLLTFALINEGLELSKADFQPVDRKIDMVEWLNFGIVRVPEIYLDVRNGKRALNSATGDWTFAKRGASRIDARPVKVQRPALFDFRRGQQPPALSALTQ